MFKRCTSQIHSDSYLVSSAMGDDRSQPFPIVHLRRESGRLRHGAVGVKSDFRTARVRANVDTTAYGDGPLSLSHHSSGEDVFASSIHRVEIVVRPSDFEKHFFRVGWDCAGDLKIPSTCRQLNVCEEKVFDRIERIPFDRHGTVLIFGPIGAKMANWRPSHGLAIDEMPRFNKIF